MMTNEKEIEDLLNQIREETTIINKASDRIVRIQSEIYKVQRRMNNEWYKKSI